MLLFKKDKHQESFSLDVGRNFLLMINEIRKIISNIESIRTPEIIPGRYCSI